MAASTDGTIMVPEPFDAYNDKNIAERKAKLEIFNQLEIYARVMALDIDWLRLHYLKSGIIDPTANNDVVLGITHHVRRNLVTASDKDKRDSEAYLRFHGLM